MDGGRPRARWLALPLYVLGVLLIAADVWGVVFWARVGGAVGIAAAVVGTVVALVLGAVLVTSVRRRWLSRASEEGSRSRSTS